MLLCVTAFTKPSTPCNTPSPVLKPVASATPSYGGLPPGVSPAGPPAPYSRKKRLACRRPATNAQASRGCRPRARGCSPPLRRSARSRVTAPRTTSGHTTRPTRPSTICGRVAWAAASRGPLALVAHAAHRHTGSVAGASESAQAPAGRGPPRLRACRAGRPAGRPANAAAMAIRTAHWR